MLKYTVDLMNSTEYKDRFKAEYLQLKIRIDGLATMLEKYLEGSLPFTPICSYSLLNSQLAFMKAYVYILEERAKIEGIDITL